MSEEPRVPIDERGGKLFRVGTVYYSNVNRGFMSAGFESEGTLPLSAVSGRVSYTTLKDGIARFRDETGVFVTTKVFKVTQGTNFGSGTIQIQDEKFYGDPRGIRPPLDSQFVERQTILMPNGKVRVVEINHGIGQKYDEMRQGKQWWRKMRDALGDEGQNIGSRQMHAFVVGHEVIIRSNLGPAGLGG